MAAKSANCKANDATSISSFLWVDCRVPSVRSLVESNATKPFIVKVRLSVHFVCCCVLRSNGLFVFRQTNDSGASLNCRRHFFASARWRIDVLFRSLCSEPCCRYLRLGIVQNICFSLNGVSPSRLVAPFRDQIIKQINISGRARCSFNQVTPILTAKALKI